MCVLLHLLSKHVLLYSLGTTSSKYLLEIILKPADTFSMPAYLSLIRHDIRGDLSKKWRNITCDGPS